MTKSEKQYKVGCFQVASQQHRGQHQCVQQVYRKQELSYSNQIARQLHTQYAEGIYRHKYYTVTLISRLRVTQGHWKRNHWIDHTRLSSSP